jgi:nitroimidazol reductase NimA-like FMN-containing flavoprotein (pyridoxamine 5'-phosphate oxidase superfamily)
MSLAMTKAEREAFLAAVHVGIFSVAQEGRPPLTVPVWYMYEPGGDLRIVTARESRKLALIQHAMCFSLCVQDENPPYRYVSVEGRVISIERPDFERHLRPQARRYLGLEKADAYLESIGGTALEDTDRVVTMRPERWLTTDYRKRE